MLAPAIFASLLSQSGAGNATSSSRAAAAVRISAMLRDGDTKGLATLANRFHYGSVVLTAIYVDTGVFEVHVGAESAATESSKATYFTYADVVLHDPSAVFGVSANSQMFQEINHNLSLPHIYDVAERLVYTPDGGIVKELWLDGDTHALLQLAEEPGADSSILANMQHPLRIDLAEAVWLKTHPAPPYLSGFLRVDSVDRSDRLAIGDAILDALDAALAADPPVVAAAPATTPTPAPLETVAPIPSSFDGVEVSFVDPRSAIDEAILDDARRQKQSLDPAVDAIMLYAMLRNEDLADLHDVATKLAYRSISATIIYTYTTTAPDGVLGMEILAEKSNAGSPAYNAYAFLRNIGVGSILAAGSAQLIRNEVLRNIQNGLPVYSIAERLLWRDGVVTRDFWVSGDTKALTEIYAATSSRAYASSVDATIRFATGDPPPYLPGFFKLAASPPAYANTMTLLDRILEAGEPPE